MFLFKSRTRGPCSTQVKARLFNCEESKNIFNKTAYNKVFQRTHTQTDRLSWNFTFLIVSWTINEQLRFLFICFQSHLSLSWWHHWHLSPDSLESMAVWPDWAKFCCLATSYLSIFLHFETNKLFQNMVCCTYLNFKSSWV